MRATKAQLAARDDTIGWLDRRLTLRESENERLRAALRSIVEAEAGERRAPLNSYEQCPYCLHMHGLAEQALEANGAQE